MEIKNIIFDLGGVLLNIDYMLTEQAFVDLGIEDFNAVYSKASQSSLFNDFEEGKVSNQAFYDGLRDVTGIQLSDEQINQAWNSMLLDMPLERIEFLEGLKSYRIFLLSNTNRVHIEAFRASMNKQGVLKRFEACFENIYYSSSIGKRKPNAEAFMHVIDENGLDISQTIFIDDSIQHVEGASQLGIQSYLLEEGEQTIEKITTVLNKSL